MASNELENLITPAQAARLRGVSVQAIVNLLDRGKLPFLTIAGKRFLKTADVLNYEPDKGGRPANSKKPNSSKSAKKKAI
ncbi:MAG TPA: helix-turn-helix domain-containing protein [Blastocatellia bacterium]|nr:helix-turn-helix domain-containing protein [Blastocatellia bacterium]